MKTQRMIIKQGVIARHTEGLRRYFGWPTVCCDENGVLYAIVSRRMIHVDPFGQVCLYRSYDGGETWSEAQVIVDDIFDDRDAGICYLGNGKMIMSFFHHPLKWYKKDQMYYKWWTSGVGRFCTEQDRDEALAKMDEYPEELSYGASYVLVSEDYGKTWGEKVHIPISCPHGPSRMNDGRLIMVGTPHNLADYKRVTGDETPYFAHGEPLCVIVSEDEGKTWKKLCDVPTTMDDRSKGGVCASVEPHIIQLRDGTLVIAYRYCNDSEYRRIGEHTLTYLTFSYNGGTRWTYPVPAKNCDGEIAIGSPPHLLETADGAIVLSYSRRATPTGIRAMISYDGGHAWGEEIILGQNWNPEDDDLGYPATTQLPTGELLTVAYRKYFDDPLPCFMYTKWRQKSLK